MTNRGLASRLSLPQPQRRIHHPAPPHVRAGRAAVRDDGLVVAVGVEEGVGEE